MKAIISTIAASLALCLSTSANADQIDDIATLATRGMVQFQCYTFGGYAKVDAAELEKHFNAGYDSFKDFIVQFDALRDEKKWKLIRDKIPLYVNWSAQGPNTDFIIGRLYAETAQLAHDEVRQNHEYKALGADPVDETPSPAVLQMRGENLYRSKNCKLLI